jgi:hypothetical protein
VAVEVGTAFSIGAGEVAPLAQRFWMGIHLQTPAFKQGDAALQPLEGIGL